MTSELEDVAKQRTASEALLTGRMGTAGHFAVKVFLAPAQPKLKVAFAHKRLLSNFAAIHGHIGLFLKELGVHVGNVCVGASAGCTNPDSGTTY